LKADSKDPLQAEGEKKRAPQGAEGEKEGLKVKLEPESQKGTLKLLGGSLSDDFNHVMCAQAIRASWFPKGELHPDASPTIIAAMYALVGGKPADELEGMLLAQMWATHAASMEAHRRSMLTNQTHEGRVENLRAGDRASRTYAILLDALNRHRGKGQQAIRVEHVNVAPGAQAIVNSNIYQQGGGMKAENEKQPHAQVTYAPGTPMPCQDQAREPLPVAAGEGPEALPDARRGEGERRPEGK